MNETLEKVIPVFIEEEMRSSYIDYSMSVIVARALPDVRDGLKPVHRRVLYGMLELGLRPTSAYKKSARIVGEVLGKYHPHGDTAVYDTMVRMVQDFSLRYPLVDGQGNFGSVDGDSPAAMRYTEARLAPIAEEVLRDLDKDTVNFTPNFDDTLKEPSVMPSLLPTLLVNGSSGIAVGMATNIPPHNLNEVVDALVALIAHPEMEAIRLRKYIQGPDFPTGAVIVGDQEIDEYFKTGRGKLAVQARARIEELRGGRQSIVVTEIPYQVNKTSLLERVAELVREKKLEGISEIRDESDREGMRIVFELRKEISPEMILRELYKHTQMQTTFGVILLALVDGQPKILTMKDMLQEFLKFRHDVVLRRTKFELDKAEKRAHILEGLKIALDHIDEVIAIIKKSRNVDTARENLMKRFKLSEIQAQAILDMRLQRLTGLERKKIEEEYLELIKLIAKFKSLLESKALRMQLVKTELLALKETYGDPRKTHILTKKHSDPIKTLLQEEQTQVIISNTGIIRRRSLAEIQKGSDAFSASTGKDFIEHAFIVQPSHHLLLFSNLGLCHAIRSSHIPSLQNGEVGTQLARLLHLRPDEKIIFTKVLAKFDEGRYIIMSTKEGLVKRIALTTLVNAKEEGTVAIALKGKDEVVATTETLGNNDIVIATANGLAIRFPEDQVRDMGLAAGGIKGIALAEGDQVVATVALTKSKGTLLSVTHFGYGKRSDLSEYSIIGRGGKGLINFKTSEKVGRVVSVLEVQDQDSLLLITKKDRVKRLKAKSVRLMGRATKGEAIAAIGAHDQVSRVIFMPMES